MPREPIEIELKDGETRHVEATHGDLKVCFSLQAFPGHADGPKVNLYAGDNGDGDLWLRMQPDPGRAAVLEERERCKAAVATTLAEHGQRQLGGAIFVAIDAPPAEKPSGYERGVLDSVRTLERLQAAVAGGDHIRREAYRYAARMLRESLLEPEPTP